MNPVQHAALQRTFPQFDLARLLHSVFEPTFGRRICILIDLPDLNEAKGCAFLANPERPIQQRAHEHFFKPLNDEVMEKLGMVGGEMFAYEQTGGSNLDLPDLCVTSTARNSASKRTSIQNYDIILCISTFSATAPLTALPNSMASAARRCTALMMLSSAPDSPLITTTSAATLKSSVSR